MRAIDADRFECVMLQDCTDEFAEGAEYILEKIDEAPTLDVEPVRYGRWNMEHERLGNGITEGVCYFARCSECGRLEDISYHSLCLNKNILQLAENIAYKDLPYCPKCGAKMRKEGKL